MPCRVLYKEAMVIVFAVLTTRHGGSAVHQTVFV